MKLEFAKMVGTGNDFIVLDNRKKVFPVGDKELIVRLCDRRKGIGSDGIILLEDSQDQDFRMRIINPDGGEVDMCGNGARCAVYFARFLEMIESSCSIETMAGIIKAETEGNNIRLNMGIPKDVKAGFLIKINNEEIPAYFVNTGVPHVVIFVSDIKNVNVVETGRMVRHHPMFQPNGTNCNFVEVTGFNSVMVRTYERGVEDETFSCGTGTCASAIAAVLYKQLKWPVISTTPLGENLTVYSSLKQGDEFKEFFLTGPVTFTFWGTIDI